MRHHGDASFAVISGDLTHHGEAQAYAMLRQLLDESTSSMPVHLMLGNHDSRSIFQQTMPGRAVTADGFVQQALRTPAGHFILLDTLDEGHPSGHLCEARLAWLDQQLTQARQTPAYLFMHHPPFSVGMDALDHCGLDNPEAFHAVLVRHGNVRHIFCGHVHRHISGSWRGIPYSTVKGTNHQTSLQLGSAPHANSAEPAGYSVILVESDTLTVHYQDI